MRQLLRIAWVLGAVALVVSAPAQPAAGPVSDAVPLLPEPPVPTAADHAVRWKLDAARAAVQDGFPALGLRLFESALEATNYALMDRPEFVLDFASALIAEDKPRDALTVLERYPDRGDAVYLLRRALASYLANDFASAERAMGRLPPSALTPADRAWYFMLQALMQERAGDVQSANSYFTRARDLAPTDAIRTQFEIFRLRNELFSGTASEGLVTQLRATERAMAGQLGGFEAGRLLAIALNQLGRSDEAISVVERMLRTPGVEQSGMRDSFLLLLGVIAGESSGRGRIALQQLLSEPGDRDLQEVGLALLARRSPEANGATEFRAFLDALIDAPAPHPLLDQLLAVRARIAASAGRFTNAEADATRILDAFPGSPLVDDMIRLLAYLNWTRQPPRYRVAADYLNRLRAGTSDPLERQRFGILIADCFFLNGDFARASDAYATVLAEATPGTLPNIAYQRVLAEIRASRLDDAAVLLDRYRGSGVISGDALWRAEWNLIDAMKRTGRLDSGLARVSALLESGDFESRPGIDAELEARLLWLRADLSLESGMVSQTPVLIDNLLAFLESEWAAAIPQADRDRVAAMGLLLKGEALLRADADAGAAVFATLRERYPLSDAAILSFLIEARGSAGRDNLVNAQKSLVDLADLFPRSRYAPIALWEAAINAEKRGLNSSYQEAIALLERLANDYPAHELVFYARLKQADLSRRLNDFGTALLLYERLISQFGSHPDVVRAQMSRGDCLFARGSEFQDSLLEAAAVYERIAQSVAAPVDLRAEASFKHGSVLAILERKDDAQAAFWLTFDRFVSEPSLRDAMGATGRYWISRAAFELAGLLEGRGVPADARRVYQRIIDIGLPGVELATSRLERLQEE